MSHFSYLTFNVIYWIIVYAVFKVHSWLIQPSKSLSQKALASVNKLFYKSGSHLLSHTVSSAVSSAAYVLTVVFGMGTGVSRKRITTGHLLSLNNSTVKH